MSESLPYSLSQSTITIMGVDLVVHHLSTGQRIIEAEGIAALFDAMSGDAVIDADAVTELAKAIRP